MSFRVFILSLALIFGTTRSAYDTTCKYVKTKKDTGATPIDWGLTYAVDECRTYATGNNTHNNTAHKKYICDSSNEIQEELWDSATCDGNLLGTQTPSANITSFNCSNTGNCQYFTVENYYNGCGDTNNYNIEPVIPDICVNTIIGNKAFSFKCTDNSSDVALHVGDSCNTSTSSPSISSQCTNVASITGFGPLMSWYATSACLNKSYEDPTTSAPTDNPTTTEAPTEALTTTEAYRETTGGPTTAPADDDDDSDLMDMEIWQDFNSWTDMHYIVAISAVVLLLVLCCCFIGCCIKCCKKDDGFYDSSHY